MQLSIAYNSDPDLITGLARFPEVREIYGKTDKDVIGGGRSTYLLRRSSKRDITHAVNLAHKNGLEFNYLLNGASLGGVEQTRQGQKKIRSLLGFLSDIKVDNITVASPYLLRLIKAQFPCFKVRVSVFASVDSAVKAKAWQEFGADKICISAIACNRDFKRLAAIRQAVSCELQLIANASCLLNCPYELTHMDMLTRSSSSTDTLKGFCLDYCFLHCSSKRLRDPVNFIRSTWIRPEDLVFYENLGYSDFKIVERGCSTKLLLRRVEAYINRRFEGNLLELVGPTAQIKKESGATLLQRLRLFRFFFHPKYIKIKSLKAMKHYAESIIPNNYEDNHENIFIDNKKLDGFLIGILNKDCAVTGCGSCFYCQGFMEKAVSINKDFRDYRLTLANELESDLHSSKHWL